MKNKLHLFRPMMLKYKEEKESEIEQLKRGSLPLSSRWTNIIRKVEN